MADDLRDQYVAAILRAGDGESVGPRVATDAVLSVRDDELERLRAELAGAKVTFNRAWEVHAEICCESELFEQRQRAVKAEAERDELRDTLNATMANFEDYVEQLRDAEAQRDALKADADRLDQLLIDEREITREQQLRAQAAGAERDRLAEQVKHTEDAVYRWFDDADTDRWDLNAMTVQELTSAVMAAIRAGAEAAP